MIILIEELKMGKLNYNNAITSKVERKRKLNKQLPEH